MLPNRAVVPREAVEYEPRCTMPGARAPANLDSLGDSQHPIPGAAGARQRLPGKNRDSIGAVEKGLSVAEGRPEQRKRRNGLCSPVECPLTG